ncbi:MAG: GNAT family N-acetyltransferase [Clostridia bacterium]|nr:GNAT family N-acetyltransferase [Clostridia bacterium]
MESFKKLVGDRIYLSPKGVSEEEIQKFTEWMNDFNVTDYTGRSGQITTLVGEKEWLENSVRNTENRNFNIVELNSDKLIGTIGLENINWIQRSAVLGIFIGDADFRNNGYGTEAIKLLLEYGFKYVNLHSIRLDLLEVNERAHRCYLKCGFKDTGLSREEIFLNGKYYDKLHMDILENEFEGNYIRNKNVK